MPTDYYTKNKPYRVFMEEYWDYYKNPPERPKLGEFDSYIEAVEFACSEIEQCLGELESTHASFWVSPEPPGLYFNSNQYEEYLNNT